MFGKALTSIAAVAAIGFAPAAHADIIKKDENGFVVRHMAEVKASPQDVYKTLRAPAKWWSPEHSWTGDAKNFYMDAQAGGCFCELIPAAREGDERGSVEHMRIVFAQPGKLMRLSGGLGPLQSEAVNGTLTIAIKPTSKGTTIVGFEYIVGGYMRYEMDTISSAVDGVIGEQLSRFSKLLGPINSDPSEANSDDEPAVESNTIEKDIAIKPKDKNKVEEKSNTKSTDTKEKSKFDEEFDNYKPSAPKKDAADDGE